MRLFSLLLSGLTLGGCVLAPQGTKDEESRLAQMNRYQQRFEQRALPDIPINPDWHDVLHRAFYANGDLEASYFEWSAAMARIPQQATWPNTNVMLSFEYMFSSEKMKSWDRTTVTGGFDPAKSLQLPMKPMKSGEVALASARSAGEKFRAAKFDLQKKVLSQWYDYVLTAERIRIQQNNLDLLKLLVDTAAARVQAGGQQQDLLKAQIEYRLSQNELQDMQAELPQMRAMLNAMIARSPDAELQPPPSLPASRDIALPDDVLLQAGFDRIPKLASLERDVETRKYSLERARMEFIPDINPMAGFTGSISQFAGASVMLPTTIPIIQGMIKESESMLKSSEAMARQARQDFSGQYVATLYALRNNERQIHLLTHQILPAAEQLLGSSRQAYSTGSVGFADLIDSQRTLLQVREQIAQARIAREKRLVELESLAGVDLETLTSLSPVLGGEGRGEGPSSESEARSVDQAAAPHPNPLPRVQGRGDQSVPHHNEANHD
jgi:outer membrane protein TolC